MLPVLPFLKWLETLKEIAPQIERVLVLTIPDNVGYCTQLKTWRCRLPFRC